MRKIIRTSTVAMSLDLLLKGQLAYLQKEYEVIAVSGNDNHLKNVSEREGVKTVSVEMQRNISIVRDLISLWKLYVLFKKEKPLIVHSITPKAGLLSMIASYFAGVPIRIHTFTGLIFPSKKGVMQQILITMDRLLCRFATNIYPEGNGVKADLISYKITNKPLKIIGNGNVNGIDIDYFDPQKIADEDKKQLKNSLGINAQDFVYIFVGRLVKDKGINELIKAFKELNASEQNIKLILVGNFEDKLDPLFLETISEIQQNKNVISVGFQEDVRKFFSIADVHVFPSYREGFPNVVIQAGAMGIPSIVTDINGSNEIIIENENGIIIPVKSSEAIKTAMENIFLNHTLRTQLSKKCRQLIIERYDKNFVWESLLSEYKFLEQNV
ncbi:glycosyltransferase involved in cell wall biosynthesis [Flavobacterium sp. 28YEA47A]|uniref:glycosyltransferase family 4 protein n=1 Tax=Flavobacterium sp. 28YEA47A TaxID=3156276 RepID=UPI003518CCAC